MTFFQALRNTTCSLMKNSCLKFGKKYTDMLQIVFCLDGHTLSAYVLAIRLSGKILL